jgi:predicted nucleic acid-binding protein
MILVDTSVWIALCRRTRPFDLERLVELDEVVTCLPVVQEVLQGFRDERAFRHAREGMLALPIVESPIREEVVLLAVDLYRRARRAGLTIRSSVDCLIAACALRHDLELLHVDRDYESLSRVSELRDRRVTD